MKRTILAAGIPVMLAIVHTLGSARTVAADSLKTVQEHYDAAQTVNAQQPQQALAARPAQAGEAATDIASYLAQRAPLVQARSRLQVTARTTDVLYEKSMAAIRRELALTRSPALRRTQERLLAAMQEERQRLRQRSYHAGQRVETALAGARDVARANTTLQIAKRVAAEQEQTLSLAARVSTAAERFRRQGARLVQLLIDELSRRAPATKGA